MGEGALLAKHCFASARTPSLQRLGRAAERGSRRVLQPQTAPTKPQIAQSLLLLLLLLRPLPLRVPGATRRNPLPQGQAGGAAAQACCTSASEARSSSRHNGSNCA